jgi:hypothetical protein
MALLPEPKQQHEPISQEQAQKALSTGKWDEQAALQLVIKDADKAENFEATKQWIMGWTTATTLYQSPQVTRYWEGTQVERSNIPRFTLATAINSLAPQIIKGLFYEDPPFMPQPRPGTSSQLARAFGAVMAYQTEDMNLRETLRLGTISCLLYGTAIFKYGWEVYKKEEVEVRRKVQPVELRNPQGEVTDVIESGDEELEEVPKEILIDRPTFEHITNLRSVLVDPGLREPDIRKARYVIHRMYLDWNEIEELRNRPGINLPSKETLLSLFFTPKETPPAAPGENLYPTPLADARALPAYEQNTEDPFARPLELLERWDKDRYILVLQRKLVLASTPNPYHAIPFFSIGWWDVPNAFWSMGLAKIIGPEQRLQAGVLNTWTDMLSIMLNGVYTRVKGQSVPTQNIRLSPGRIIEIDKENALQPLTRHQPVPEVMEILQLSASTVEQSSGANEFSMQGVAGASGHSNLARTAAGANYMATGAGSRAEDFVEKLCNQVFVPFLYAMADLDKRLMPLKTMRYILSDELDHEFLKGYSAEGKAQKNDIIDLYNARLKFSISAGAKMLARRNMAQSLPIMLQFLSASPIVQSLAIEKKKVDAQELVRMMFEVSDWKNYQSVVIPMTEEDEKRWQAMQPGAAQQAKFQGQAALQAQQNEAAAQRDNDNNIARAAREVLRQGIEQSATPMAVGGEPGGPGFGGGAV